MNRVTFRPSLGMNFVAVISAALRIRKWCTEFTLWEKLPWIKNSDLQIKYITFKSRTTPVCFQFSELCFYVVGSHFVNVSLLGLLLLHHYWWVQPICNRKKVLLQNNIMPFMPLCSGSEQKTVSSHWPAMQRRPVSSQWQGRKSCERRLCRASRAVWLQSVVPTHLPSRAWRCHAKLQGQQSASAVR